MLYAIEKIKDLIEKNPNHFKTKSLGRHLKNYSNQLERDIKGKRRRNRTFEYGTIIYVDFGINFGSEFSSPHYAITLAKNDKKNYNTIPIVPLTSKSGFNNLELNCNLAQYIGTVQAYATKEYLDKIQKPLVEEMNIQLIKENISASRSLKSDEYSKESFERIKELEKLSYINRKSVIESKERLKKYITDLSKTTYIKLDSITTVDKCKIFKKKNILDPLGSILLPKEDLIQMSAQLSLMFSVDE